jgi:hypothetical protein
MPILTALLFLLPTAPPDSLPYNLSAPALTINFANEDLKEISALSPADSTGVFLALNDEVGEIFFLDGNGGGAAVGHHHGSRAPHAASRDLGSGQQRRRAVHGADGRDAEGRHQDHLG